MPVSIVQCDGNVIGTDAITRVKRSASAARRSMVGVADAGPP